MLVGIMGKMGTGKTLSMSILAEYFSIKSGSSLYANYALQNSQKINSLNQVWQLENGIFCFDELWLTMDSRLYNDNVVMTRWINQTRKKKMVIFYTTQHIRQVELRVRNATDILIVCEKKPSGIWLNFIDYQFRTLGRRFLISNPKMFYTLYNTYEVLEPLKFDRQIKFADNKIQKNSSNNLDV